MKNVSFDIKKTEKNVANTLKKAKKNVALVIITIMEVQNVKKKSMGKAIGVEKNKEKKALCIIGARQIGKTTLVREFGRCCYEHFVEINFITDKKAHDIGKYAESSNKIKAKAIFDSIPSQLNNKNRRFILTKVDEHGRQNRYSNSFEWLSEAGVALPCYNVTEPQAPIQLNEKHSLFKLFMSDTGLLCAASMENIQFDILQGDLDIDLGSILENVMAQAIKSNGFNLHYYDSKRYGEVDFVIGRGVKVDLIEIKSGNDYKKHNALNSISRVQNWTFDRRIVFCKGNVECYESIYYMPFYMIMFYNNKHIVTDMKYEIDLSALEGRE